ncbi:MAG TPA: hypothetical protein PKK00_01760 [Bacteroidales bacterium]|nr:hypothetical protein [Bacteroidales bacterium]HPS16181.1 hypothetical protein [Bacteroidales bacterium]
MQNLSYEKMQTIEGGTFLGGFCAGVAIASLVAPNPVTGVLGVGCIGYAIGSEFNWW